MNLLEKIAEIAVRRGLEVAWREIEQALRHEAPELLPADLPHTDESYEAAVKKKEAELMAGDALSNDDTETPSGKV